MVPPQILEKETHKFWEWMGKLSKTKWGEHGQGKTYLILRLWDRKTKQTLDMNVTNENKFVISTTYNNNMQQFNQIHTYYFSKSMEIVVLQLFTSRPYLPTEMNNYFVLTMQTTSTRVWTRALTDEWSLLAFTSVLFQSIHDRVLELVEMGWRPPTAAQQNLSRKGEAPL